MRYLKIRITRLLEDSEILGADGKTYRVACGQIVTLPEPNALIFLNGGVAELIEVLDEADLFLEEVVP